MFSALPPKADVAQRGRHVSKVPEPDSSNASHERLFDHLVGSRQYCRRDGKLAPVPQQKADYSITSLAKASNVGGIVSPSAFAVFMLITSSNLVACSTGKSAGLAPFSIL